MLSNKIVRDSGPKAIFENNLQYYINCMQMMLPKCWKKQLIF